MTPPMTPPMTPWEPEDAPLGVVLEAGRGSLPFLLVHGEALVAAAAWALGESGVQPLDLGVGWELVAEVVAERGTPLVLHDSLCPLTPPAFIAEVAATAHRDDVVAVGVRPVTDTVKQLGHDRLQDSPTLGRTVDRDTVVAVCSPLALPARVVAGLPALPGGGAVDLAVLATVLAAHTEVRRLVAPVAARRVGSADDVALLEALDPGA